jgi:aminopeptidase N
LESNPLFQLPIEVSWYEYEIRKTKTLKMTRAFQQFALENGSSVTQVYIDEGKNLLARRVQEITADQFAIQFKESTLGIARYEALDSLVAREAKDQLLTIIPLALKDSFWSIRENVLGFLQNDPEWRTSVRGMEEMVYDLAEKDPKNSVRAAAIDLLATWDSDKYKSTFLRMANDSSYLIASSALMALVGSEENPIDSSVIERFATDRNFRITIPVAEYYILQGVVGKGQWFLDRLDQLSGEGLYYYLGYFSEYFSRFPEEGESLAVSKLLTQMENNSKSYLRRGAFLALLSFADNEEVITQISRLAGKEKDQELKNYYNYFLETLK